MPITEVVLPIESSVEWIRLAAYIDGEGYIAISSKNSGRHAHHLELSIGNTDPRLLDYLISTFGGNIKRGTGADLRTKHFWVWHVYGHRAAELLRFCVPHFIMKRDQAEIALSFQTLMGSRSRKGVGGLRTKISDEVEGQRATLMFKLREVRQNTGERIAS